MAPLRGLPSPSLHAAPLRTFGRSGLDANPPAQAAGACPVDLVDLDKAVNLRHFATNKHNSIPVATGKLL
jgi:hypothetical protein